MTAVVGLSDELKEQISISVFQLVSQRAETPILMD